MKALTYGFRISVIGKSKKGSIGTSAGRAISIVGQLWGRALGASEISCCCIVC